VVRPHARRRSGLQAMETHLLTLRLSCRTDPLCLALGRPGVPDCFGGKDQAPSDCGSVAPERVERRVFVMPVFQARECRRVHPTTRGHGQARTPPADLHWPRMDGFRTCQSSGSMPAPFSGSQPGGYNQRLTSATGRGDLRCPPTNNARTVINWSQTGTSSGTRPRGHCPEPTHSGRASIPGRLSPRGHDRAVHRTRDEGPPQNWRRVRRHLVHCVGLRAGGTPDRLHGGARRRRRTTAPLAEPTICTSAKPGGPADLGAATTRRRGVCGTESR